MSLLSVVQTDSLSSAVQLRLLTVLGLPPLSGGNFFLLIGLCLDVVIQPLGAQWPDTRGFRAPVILGYRDGFRSITAPETVTMTVSTPRSIG